MSSRKQMITIETTVRATPQQVWTLWTEPAHIQEWNSASPEWHCPSATQDLREGGRFTARMEAKDGSMGFDFGGTYDEVIEPETLSYTLDDDRGVSIQFLDENGSVRIVETFEAESQNPADMQRAGWQAILDHFRTYAESRA